MGEEDKKRTINVNVTELFGIQVLRTYVKTIQENKEMKSDCGLRILQGALTMVVLSTIVCSGVMVGLLYHPPPLVRELSDSILTNIWQKSDAKSPEFAALQEQLRNANQEIGRLKDEMKRLRKEGIANYTREVGCHANLSQVMNENAKLLGKLSDAIDSVGLLNKSNAEKDRRNQELKQELDICMLDKDETQKSLSNAEKQEIKVQRDFDTCRDEVVRLKKNVEVLESNKSKFKNDIKEADQLSDVLEKNLKACDKSLESVKVKENTVNSELSKTKVSLTRCKAENTQHEETNAKLTTQLSTCNNGLVELNRSLQAAEKTIKDLESEKTTLEKDLKDTRFRLGNCKNKNMDHEVQNLELLEEIESLKKELKAC